ncbi:MAG: hypothetical protein IJI56_06970 [Firmicutes bacterium]|nr:hypothetical protein [Oscillospiraceae bacterium]MBR0417531.1 hypothetical protein [Bacillota bacterium]
MKKTISVKKRDISKRTAFAILAVLIAFRLFLSANQLIFSIPGSAPIDDDLYFTLARNIAEGNWLGEYNYLTLSKYPFFAVYLAFIHFVKIPYLIANCILWILVAALASRRVEPIVKTRRARLFVFVALMYNPSTWAQYTLRVYRDTFFPIICALFFFATMGWALRIKEKASKWLPYITLSGIGLALAYVSREDGYWIWPFAVTGFVIVRIYVAVDRQVEKKAAKLLVSLAIPVICTFAAVSTICSLNQKYYGQYILTDFAKGPFAECYANMTRLSHEDWNPLVAVPRDVRERLYEQCPSFAEFEEILEEGVARKAYYNSELDDYQSGAFYWALRLSAQLLGHSSSCTEAMEFWSRLSDEVEKVIEKDPGRLGPRSSITPPIRSEYVAPVLNTAKDSVFYILSFKGMERWEPTLSDVTTGRLPQVEAFVHNRSNYSAVEYTADPYYTPFQKFTNKACEYMTGFYRIAITPLLIISLAEIAVSFVLFKRLDWKKQLLQFVLLGFILMGLFRIFIISYMEVAAFNIGIYSMYLGCVYPLLVFICAMAPFNIPPVRKKTEDGQ